MKIRTILEGLDKQNISYDFYGSKEQSVECWSCLKKCLPNSVLIVKDASEAAELAGKPVLAVSESKLECAEVPNLIVQDPEAVYSTIISMLEQRPQIPRRPEALKERFPNAALECGENVWIAEGAILSGRIIVGNDVIIKAGAVIGQEGYEFQKDKQGVQHRIPSQGGIIIGDGAEIGANTCIDRGIYGDTVIGRQVKISNLCHIAHDVVVGNGTMIGAKVSISFFAQIGENCTLGAGATLRDNIQIGAGVFVGIGAVVTESILDKHSVFGNPAVEYQRKKKLIKVDHISKTYGNDSRKTLDNITFEIAVGEFVSIVGPSGCGKSTLLKIMAGLLDSDAGRLLEKKEDGVNIGMIFQEDALLPWFTVEKNVEIGLKIQKEAKDKRKERTKWAIKVVGLEGYEKYYPHQLSGGMKKRAAIARSLVLNSELLLMDEPFGALDAVTRSKIQEDLLQLQRENGFSVCMVTHDIEEAIALSNRIVVVAGKPAEIRTIVSVNLAARNDHNSEEFLALKRAVLDMIDGHM